MTDSQIKHMVDRFLGWHLPDDFKPDGGIFFKRETGETVAEELSNVKAHLWFGKRPVAPTYPLPMPTGTNLFDASQAEAMIRYMVEGLPSP